MLNNNLHKIMESQKKFFQTQQTKSLDFRITQLKKLRAAICEFEEQIFEALKKDLGKSPLDAYTAEVGHCLAEISHYIANLKKWNTPRKIKSSKLFPMSKAQIQYEPLGLSLIIAPWNYPFELAILPLISAIGAGNCITLKPSEIAVNTEKVIFNMFNKYFNNEYIYIFCGGIQETQHILSQKFDHIFFTGGEKTGKIIMQAASEYITPLVLELGGKSPCIVDNNISLEKSAKRITWGKFYNAGQTCVAPDYLLVHKDIRDKLISEIKKNILNFYGPTPETSVDFGHIINTKHFERLTKFLTKGNIIYGGQKNPENLFIAPTLITNISLEDDIMQEEIFGPILPIIDFKEKHEVIDIITKKPKPLTLYIFSKNKIFQNEIINKTSSGSVCINDCIVHLTATDLAFGGVGSSGFGRYHGKAGFEALSNQKSIFKQTTAFDMPKRFPPSDKTSLAIMKKLLK